MFNLGYELLSWKLHRALVRAKLEPFLGYLHSIQEGKPSLICDFQEPYRYLVDDYIIGYCMNLKVKDFVMKNAFINRKKKAKREYLNDEKTKEFTNNLNQLFENRYIEIPRIRVGNRQTDETLINEEALLLAKYLRNEREDWIPRVPSL